MKEVSSHPVTLLSSRELIKSRVIVINRMPKKPEKTIINQMPHSVPLCNLTIDHETSIADGFYSDF